MAPVVTTRTDSDTHIQADAPPLPGELKGNADLPCASRKPAIDAR